MKKPLPARPSLEQLKKQAKSFINGYGADVPEILARIREHHPHWRNATAAISQKGFTLADAQLVIAREYGFESWPKLKAHVLSRRESGSTPDTIAKLHEAAGQGDVARINSLLDGDASLINELGGPGVRTALHQAVFGLSEAAVELLLERGADPNIRCEGDNAHPLHFAVEKNNFSIVRLLIEHGADPVGEDDYHELGVMGWATAWEYVHATTEMVSYLLAHGGRHNIFSAVATGDVTAIREIMSQVPGDLEKRMDVANRRRRPLHLAVIKKQPRSLVTLLDLGAKTGSLDEAGFTALDQAALSGEAEMARTLLEHGAKIRLPAAVALGRVQDVEKLLRRDPDALKPGGRWSNLIVRASEKAPGSVIEALIEAGASVSISDDPKTSVDSTYGYTPLHAAAFNGNLSAASALLKFGADVRMREEKYHGTPAGWAQYAGHMAVRDRILLEPVDLMEALEYQLSDRVQTILREDGEALNRPFLEYPLYPLYAEGWHTPLAFAVTRGYGDMVRLLLALGADRTIRNPAGKSLREIAELQGHQGIAELLQPKYR